VVVRFSKSPNHEIAKSRNVLVLYNIEVPPESSVAEVEEPSKAAPSSARRIPHWLSRLRSYAILDPLIFFYTLILGSASLAASFADPTGAKQHAIAYVSGFNAADPAQVSVQWLVHGRAAEEEIQGDRAFHISGGYQTFLDLLTDDLASRQVPIHLNTKVQRVRWNTGQVEIGVVSGKSEATFSAPRAVITFPLGVLQSAAQEAGINFDPQLPAEKLRALEKLAMGKVVRVTLCFRRRIWEDITAQEKTLAGMSFLFSDDKLFPTWWTQMPDPVPMITGWAPAASAENLRGMSEGRIVQKAIETLSSLLGLEQSLVQSELVGAYFHDWDLDPFSQGAYSYVKAGGEGCQRTLGAPVDSTLFFAGEATDVSGHNGTVHGAIASGKRAAQEILALR